MPPYTIPVLEGKATSKLLTLFQEQVTPDPNNANVASEKMEEGLHVEVCNMATLNVMMMSFETCESVAATTLGIEAGEGVGVTLLVADDEDVGITPNERDTEMVGVSDGEVVSETVTVVDTVGVVDKVFVPVAERVGLRVAVPLKVAVEDDD